MKGISKNLRWLPAVALLALSHTVMDAVVLTGVMTDGSTGEPLVGASVYVDRLSKGTVSDIDGIYMLELPAGRYGMVARYIGYTDYSAREIEVSGDTVRLDITMNPDSRALQEVTVTAIARKDSEVSQIQEQKQSQVVQNGVSAQEIARAQDKDASEVIRRIPGISVIDGKFVMVRGLSQRYNNVWLNGSAVPSSEADTRAFSFDIIPSSQIDNMVIVKTPAPEYPADFTGGFVMVDTRRQPHDTGFDITLGAGMNDRTHFREFVRPDGKLSFLKGGLDAPLSYYPGFGGRDGRIDPVASSFDNNWKTRTIHPLADLKASAALNRSWHVGGGTLWLVGALNFSETYRTLLDMENSLYGPFDAVNGRSVPLRKATDNQYTRETRYGAMLNLSFRPGAGMHLFEWKNIFNQIIKDRYSERTGFNAQADNINDMEYYHSSRPTLNTQLTGTHTFGADRIGWSAGYAFARRNLPDRRLIERTDRTEQTMGIYRISREFTRLDEHTGSLSGNWRHEFGCDALHPVLKGGLYAEYRTRSYRTRQFQYGWQPDNSLPDGFMFDPDVQEGVLTDANYGPDRLYLYEEVNYLNNYNARQALGAAFIAADISWHRFDVHAGARYEYCRQTLGMNTRQYEESLHDTPYDYSGLFPSVNVTYRISDRHQLRAAYGRSTNRPEFRELSSSVYYDFDLGSSVMGNPDLRAAKIDNVDFRWEWYPSKGEQVSVALFYKHFADPIEWTYTVAGGTDLIYSFINARGADNYGVELDIRKNLGFIGLHDFSLSFNGALIKSKVVFDRGTNNIDRPMQGQSPYLVNAGLFYTNTRLKFSAAVLYNIIGRRIIGVGNRYGTASDGTARNIPNSYEMPRHSLDLSVSKTFGRWNLKLAARDIIAQEYVFRQIESVTVGGNDRKIEETTRSYKPGRNFNITIGYSF